jgi:glycosyltransferase involved in cell wall biosynthesis
MEKPLRIIYPVSEGFDSRKARFHQIFQTAHALARQGCEVDLLIGKNRIDVLSEVLPYYDLPEHQNLRIHSLPMLRRERGQFLRISWNGVFHLAALIKIRGLFRQRPYEAIFLRHLNLGNFFSRFKNRIPIPMIFETHEIFHLTTERKKKVRKIQAEESRVYNQIDGVVATTQWVAGKLREIFNLQAPVAVIPNGANIQFFLATCRRPKMNKIVYVGQLYPWKGTGILIEALKYVPQGELHIVGGGDQVQKMRQMALQVGVEGRIFFHGQVSPGQVRDHLAEATVAVHPLGQNIDAQFTSPLKLFEYMAARVPIVASDLPSTREVLTHGVNAFLVPPDNPLDLAAGIQEVLSDREMADRLSQRAHEDVLAYSWDRRAERLIHFLRTVAGHPC